MKLRNNSKIIFCITQLLFNNITVVHSTGLYNFFFPSLNTNDHNISMPLKAPEIMLDMIMKQKFLLKAREFMDEDKKEKIMGNHIIEIYNCYESAEKKLFKVYRHKNADCKNIHYIWKIIILPKKKDALYFLLEEVVILHHCDYIAEMLKIDLDAFIDNHGQSYDSHEDYLNNVATVKKVQKHSYVNDKYIDKWLKEDYTTNKSLEKRIIYNNKNFSVNTVEGGYYIGENKKQKQKLMKINTKDFFENEDYTMEKDDEGNVHVKIKKGGSFSGGTFEGSVNVTFDP